MLLVISPAKTLDETPMHEEVGATIPRFWGECAPLVQQLQAMSVAELAELMDISPKLAQLNVERYAAFPSNVDASNSKPAIFCFDGDVYDAITPELYDGTQRAFMQECVRILSGLYGMIRPLDRLYPYRLEMGTKLQGTSLYDFWGKRVTDALNDDAKMMGAKHLINLASQEYSRVIQRRDLAPSIIDVDFRHIKADKLVTIGVHAKKARGAMVDFIVRHGIMHPEDMKDFAAMGYAYAAQHSNAQTMVFVHQS